METWSRGTPAKRFSMANVSRSMWEWHRFGVPSALRISARRKRLRKQSCQRPRAISSVQFSLLKKKRGLGVFPSAGVSRRDLATSEGNGTYTGCPVLCWYRRILSPNSLERSRFTASPTRRPLYRISNNIVRKSVGEIGLSPFLELLQPTNKYVALTSSSNSSRVK